MNLTLWVTPGLFTQCPAPQFVTTVYAARHIRSGMARSEHADRLRARALSPNPPRHHPMSHRSMMSTAVTGYLTYFTSQRMPQAMPTQMRMTVSVF